MNKHMARAVAAVSCAAMVLGSTAMVLGADDYGKIAADGSISSVQNIDTGVVAAQINNKTESTLLDGVNNEKENVDKVYEAQIGKGDEENATTEESQETVDIVEEVSEFDRFTDVSTHWGKAAIEKAYNDGLLRGYEDETMRPNDKITGAQMVTIITRVLNTSLKTDISGLADTKWYKDAASKALALGIIDSEDISALNEPMSRKDACIMMSDAFQIERGDPDMTKASTYSDFAGLTRTEKQTIAELVNKGYIQGWNDSLMLSGSITRAEFVTILYRVAEEYLKITEEPELTEITSPTVLTGTEFKLSNKKVSEDIWLGGNVETVLINNSELGGLTIRSDNLSKLEVKNSNIDVLTIAASQGNVNLDSKNIGTVVVGDGGGAVTLDSEKGDIEVTGSKRNVTILNEAENIIISGDSNEITIKSSADAKNIKIYGMNNAIQIDSQVEALVVSGKDNLIKGIGSAKTVELYSKSSTVNIEKGSVVDKRDYGIADMTASVSAPTSLAAGAELKATAVLNNIPVGKNVTIEWYIDGKLIKTDGVKLSESTTASITHKYAYSLNMATTSAISFLVKYTTDEEENQVVSAPAVTVNLQNYGTDYYTKNAVTTYYKGNATTQWAIDHNLSDAIKESFVNTQGYSSTSQYLIWVNIGTQYTSVFQGSKGNWKLIRSGLVSTGANDATPRGVFQTTYKQTNWTTSTYTVSPVVRFYGGGYALHSRLYQPKTTTLKGGKNGVGYPLSHGCVRMQADDIQWIYDNVPKGTTVVVY